VYTIEEIRRIVQPIAEKYRIPAIYLFGSYARGTATDSSDIDFIVDTAGTELKSLMSLGKLYCDLEAALGKKIDLITVGSLRQKALMPSEESFRNTVWTEKVSLYDVA
jgi:hypothetical protein